MAQRTGLIDSLILLNFGCKKAVPSWETTRYNEIIFSISANHPTNSQFLPNYLNIYCQLGRLVLIASYKLSVIFSVKLYEFNKLTVD
ncbi:hypothetical protein [cyanobacterium endosymbiont of Rhopalodia gibberula]|uniref:hypothetical protein n=1 Tax=cyanobacterium endosymbiont of Rhopalodia gibberula TaxID=1763363 RepID=UPI000E658827|nr:hypothetical protein [cyanobacterium endosymbiont of Rhopalodia gibberula]